MKVKEQKYTEIKYIRKNEIVSVTAPISEEKMSIRINTTNLYEYIVYNTKENIKAVEMFFSRKDVDTLKIINDKLEII